MLASSFTFLSAQEKKFATQKVYVNSEQIVVTNEGILAYLQGREKPLVGKTLSYDAQGKMYLEKMVSARGPCYLHDLWCHRCGGCGVLLCPMNCSCYD